MDVSKVQTIIISAHLSCVALAELATRKWHGNYAAYPCLSHLKAVVVPVERAMGKEKRNPPRIADNAAKQAVLRPTWQFDHDVVGGEKIHTYF